MIDVEKLNALIDNELDTTERAEVEAALAQDSHAAQELGSLRLLKDALRDHVKPVHCEDEWRSCVKRLNEIDRASKTKSVVDRWAWAMCSCLFAFIVVVGMYNRINPNYKVGTGELTRASMGSPIRDVARVYQWVKDRFGAAPAIPQERVRVIAADEGAVDGHPFARFVLQDSKGEMNLLVLPGVVQVEGVTPMDDGVHFTGRTGDATSVVWNERGIVMQLTGQRDANELRDIANEIQVNP